MPDRQISKTAPHDAALPQAALGQPVLQRGLLLLPPLNAVLELALFVAVVLAFDAFVPSFSLSNIEPNPSWLPVLLLSVQYGTVSGLLAAATCIALSFQTGFAEQDVGENLFVYLLRVWAQPMLWIAAAVLLGQFRTRHIAERAELKQELATLSNQRMAIAEYANNLRARCDALERHLASREGPEAVALLAAISTAGTSGAADLAGTFQALMGTAFPGASSSLLLLRANGLEVAARCEPDNLGGARHGAAEAAGLVLEAEPAAALLRELERRRRPVSVLTPEGERQLAGKALVAVPVEVGDRIGAVVLLHALDAQLLTPSLTTGLPVLAAALSPVVEAALSGRPLPPRASHAATADGGAAPQPWLKRLWTARATSDTSPTADPVSPPTRRLVR